MSSLLTKRQVTSFANAMEHTKKKIRAYMVDLSAEFSSIAGI